MANVILEPAGPERRATLANLFQLYTYDFTEQWAGEARGELAEDGTFEPYPYLDSYWTEPGREAFLVRVDGDLAGFVLLNDHSHAGLPVDHAVAEFFIVRKHRRGGVGHLAATAAIGPRPGQWELAVARRNAGALAFWRGVAAELASGPVEALDTTTPWNGTILRFVVA
ncbi:MAG: GNAT family N-acetyltransferase [Phenylobacterium sp.]|uniref:GNAT family N-acetyltransferase n=1 Tax=Phenylobacterium sp. TaxID=1871053 RepID=UPI0025D00F65|nr:GNAT family N-acetyltransferase [Phenylobacterium sp.]MBI1200096.1 GNAT family N-acetyltransferase [Phenylobacterium sp.]